LFVPESGVLARRSSKPSTRLSTRGEGFARAVARLAPRCLVEGTSAPVGPLSPRHGSFDRALTRTQKTRSAELCNPRYQRRAPVLGVAAARLASARLVPSGELCASTATKPASAGLSWRGGRTFSARSRAQSGPASDASSPAALPPFPQCGHSFCAADRDRFHRGRVERLRLPRSKTPSIDKEPGRLFTFVAIRLRDDMNDHDATSPVADEPHRARPRPPLSAATESGFLDPPPLADFCNHFTEHGHTERSTIPRAKLTISALFAAPAETGAASGTAPEGPFGASG
jgi:hypothetical protein